ncbi:hypothetical protein GCM10009819_12660 [Agromyces tropicus]|uniref:DUF1707 domain-containing protein n=1 Tax=Agromyces tropicus TaxID=555371 RepID=A0ABN2U6C7_9MICO
MPDANRIAELQRQAYGAGTDDEGRAAAAAELARIRSGGGHDAHADEPSARAATPSGDGGSPTTDDVFDDLLLDADADAGADADAEGTRDGATTPTSMVVRVAALAAAVALAIGFAAGWATGLGIAGAANEPEVPDSSLVFPLSEPPPDVALEDARAAAVFDREQEPSDVLSLEVSPESMGVDAGSTRLLATLPEGTSVFAGRAAGGDGICLLAERADVAASAGCTNEDAFPGGGLQLGFDLEGDFITVTWDASGQVSVAT